MATYEIELKQGDTLVVTVPEDDTPVDPPVSDHDINVWHPLTQAIGHHHGDNPNTQEMVDIFGEAGAWFGQSGRSISYPWMTFTGADREYEEWDGNESSLENVAKHPNYTWICRSGVPSNGRTRWISAMRILFHAAGFGYRVRTHSFSAELQVTHENGFGIIRYGGWIDYGRLEVDGQIVHLDPSNPVIGNTAKRRIHPSHGLDIDALREGRISKNDIFWYGRHEPEGHGVAPQNPLFPSALAFATGDASVIVDPENPNDLMWIGEDTKFNDSTAQIHFVSVNVKASNAYYICDRYGRRLGDWQPDDVAGLDSIPMIIENVPVGRYSHRDDRDLGLPATGLTDWDISPVGEDWIDLPISQ